MRQGTWHAKYCAFSADHSQGHECCCRRPDERRRKMAHSIPLVSFIRRDAGFDGDTMDVDVVDLRCNESSTIEDVEIMISYLRGEGHTSVWLFALCSSATRT